MSEIQKEQLEAFTEAHVKSALALEKLTGTLEIIVRTQEKLFEEMTKSVPDKIMASIINSYNSSQRLAIESLGRIETAQKETADFIEKGVPGIIEDKLNGSAMAVDMKHVKWFVGIVGGIVITVMIVLKIIGVATPDKTSSLQIKLLENMLKQQTQEKTNATY